IGISSFIDSMNVGVLGNIIAEKETGLNIKLCIALNNLGRDYEALYADTDAAGITNKVGVTADLSKKLGEIEGTSVVVLLKDIDSDLIIDKPTLLNLNGFSIKGDLTANSKTIVIDSNIEYDKVAEVTGNVAGNITLVAGKYAQDVSEFVKTGFAQNDEGVVANQYYDISKDEKGNVVVSLNAGLVHTNSMPDIAGLAVDIACDLLFNGYSSNYLELDGKTIYNITLEDLIGLYSSSNRLDSVINEALKIVDTQQLSAFVNTVLDDAADLMGIAEAIESDKPVFEYSMVTKPWNMEFTHVVDGDYITSSVVSGGKTNSTNIKICVVGSKEDKLNLAEFFKELGRTISADININVSHTKVENDIKVNASADASVIVDWTNPDYAIMFGVIIADGLNGATRENLVNGIRDYYESGNMNTFSIAFNALKTSDVITAINNLKISDSFATMVKSLGLDDVVNSEVVKLEALYDKIGKVMAAVVRRAGLTGGNRTVGSFLDSDGTYGMSRENIEKLYRRGLFRGYSLNADMSIDSAVFKIKLFGESILVPEFVNGTGALEILGSDKIAGSVVNYDKMMITIDTDISGITVGQLKNLLKLKVNNADSIEIIIGDGSLSDDALVANGTKLTAIARNKNTTEVDIISYTIIVMGDINCNGRIEVGDAVLISRMLVGEYEFNEIQLLASDNNCNGRTDIGDATRIANKIVDWDNYKSMLDAESTVM
ncbi:MAG: dockerin type I repeat-containing protein, partial [Clostridia bacterium]|nr:dockerin type I repeat-containing protein [Clostridia bacterium]